MKLLTLPRNGLQNMERMVEDAAAGLSQITKTVAKRTPASSGSSSTCAPNSSDPLCEKPTTAGNTQTLAIVLGVVIPMSIAVCVLIFLHRRHLKKQRLEDINDPHKSLDFGMEGVVSSKPGQGRRGKGIPEMTVSELGGHQPGRPGRAGRGLSMDMGIGSPYLLPAGLNGSRESLHSMARSQHDEHDPYRPIAMHDDYIRSGRNRDDKASLYSNSTGQQSSGEKATLLTNARPMSQSFPTAMSPNESLASSNGPVRPMHSTNRSIPQSRKSSLSSEQRLQDVNVEPFPALAMPEPAAQQLPPPRKSSAAAQQQFPPRKQSKSAQPGTQSVRQSTQSSFYGDEPPPLPRKDTEMPYDIEPALLYNQRFSIDEPTHVATASTPAQNLHAPAPVAGNRLSVMGLRPLPPDIPEDNPEQRANRIRSFYKEYFDDSRPNPAYGKYEEDVDPAFLEGAVYDPNSGGFFMGGGQRPFAQPVGRRAMTPPPRGPPRSNVSSAMGVNRNRKLSVQSTGRLGPRGRAQSAPKKKLPPPVTLHSLPTPSALKGDIEVFNPLDFAPPSSFRQLQNGSRPDTPNGIDRPYSPSVRAFTPLASSFSHLNVMPSPHELRKSGTFTALDFAPPSRIRDPAMLSPGGSDAGSIRSNRSGISTMQSEAIRNGAYRVSRIPKNIVTTQDDMATQLKPKLDMISRA